jgi:large subunit ribosomal protein L25
MAISFELNAEKRDDTGKGASRRLRRAGMIPAILYGADQEPQMLSLRENEINKGLEHEGFYSHVLDVKVAGEVTKAILRDLQRHPHKPTVLHVDFQRVDPKKKIHIHIPLHFLNEETAPGVKMGGMVTHELIEVEAECLPGDIPEFLEVNVGALNVGDSIHLSDLKLPKGVALVELAKGEGHDLSVVSIHGRKGAAEEEPEAAEESGEE